MGNTNKTKEVLKHLKNKGSITSWEAIQLYGATRLSAIETWHFIAPILAMHGGTLGDKLDLFDKAYVKIYSALKYWDEHHKDDEGDKK